MTDRDLVAKKLAQIETYVQELRRNARLDAIAEDIREERFVEHTLQLAIQAALDVASHIASSERLGEPESYRDLFDRLARAGWIGAERVPQLRNMAGFRNLLVHGYAEVDPVIVREIVANHLDDLLGYAEELRERIRRS